MRSAPYNDLPVPRSRAFRLKGTTGTCGLSLYVCSSSLPRSLFCVPGPQSIEIVRASLVFGISGLCWVSGERAPALRLLFPCPAPYRHLISPDYRSIFVCTFSSRASQLTHGTACGGRRSAVGPCSGGNDGFFPGLWSSQLPRDEPSSVLPALPAASAFADGMPFIWRAAGTQTTTHYSLLPCCCRCAGASRERGAARTTLRGETANTDVGQGQDSRPKRR